jgi:hypothetical protein
MITVEYDDEDPVTYLSEKDRKVLEHLKYLFGGTIREVCEIARATILAELDPIPFSAQGEPFIFPRPAPGSLPDFCWISPTVPDPYARVDLFEALNVAERDARACQMTLEYDNSTEAVLGVYRNTISWLRFWCVRFSKPEWRTRFAKELEAREEGLAELRAKAFRKGNLEMMEELARI